jgi:hypothetical protein
MKELNTMEIKIYSPLLEVKVFQVNDNIFEVLSKNSYLQDKLKQIIENSELLKKIKIVEKFRPTANQIIECNNLEECFEKLGMQIKYDTSINMCILYKNGELTKAAYQVYNGHYFLLRLSILNLLEEEKLATHK